jgi:serine/threonine-protein kinase
MEESVAHYRLLDRLGEGGLGEVFRARDTKVGRTVALKRLARGFLDKPGRRERFRADAVAAAALSHPNLATLFDVGEDNGRAYLAYEYVTGRTLRKQIAGGPMNPRTALEIAVQLADALAEAHAHGIAHTDLRPDNIVITAKGSAKLLETGMAGWTRGGAVRAQIASASEARTHAAVLPYMSPEQLRGEALDARTDIYSLGVIVYEMLTGVPPSDAAAAASATRRIRPGSGVDVPRELDATLGRALAKDLNARQQSAVSFAAELRSVAAILDVRAGESPPSTLIPLDDDRSGAGKWWALAAGLAVLGAAAWLWLG